MKNKVLLTGAFVITAASAIALNNANEANASDKEKCYGVVKAGKNDCASKDGAHSCAGLAKKDSDTNEWVYLPTGACDRLTGGMKG